MFAVAGTAHNSSRTKYLNLDLVSQIVAVQISTKWYAKALREEGDVFILDAAGYNDQAAANAAIETLLGI